MSADELIERLDGPLAQHPHLGRLLPASRFQALGDRHLLLEVGVAPARGRIREGELDDVVNVAEGGVVQVNPVARRPE